MKRKIFLAVLVVTVCVNCSGCYLFTPSARIPKPTHFTYLHNVKTDGRLLPLELNPKNIYGMGLTYAAHLRETGQEFDGDKPPPVFKKALTALNLHGDPVSIPSKKALIESAELMEAGLGEKLEGELENLNPLLDYEGELGFVLLEEVDWRLIDDPAYSPKIGYFIANDLSARTIALLGEGMDNQYEYWGASKSFPGFLPVGKYMWVPDAQRPESVPDVEITTAVNGEIRQKQSTSDMMYTPRQMLLYITQEYPESLPGKGDMVLTGTPGGVALQVPAWKAWLADILNLDRFSKLTFSIMSAKNNKKFLKPGDTVEVSAGILGNVKTQITRNIPN